VSRSHSIGIVLFLSGALRLAGQQATSHGQPFWMPTPADSMAVERMIDSLPLRARVAQVVMPWIPGNYAAFDDSAFTVMQGWVDSLGVGGLIVSVGAPVDVAMKLNRLQRRSRLPLLVAADLESGASLRLYGATPFPSNMGVAAAGSEQDAYDVGRIAALEGRAVGIRVAFAPVADVNNNPANPIINTRSFGENAYAVARLVAASIRGMQDNGMLATAKHFPGHGDTQVDSHLELPVIPAPWSQLDTVEMVPFRAAIEAGTGLVMSAHIVLPRISGDHRPATLAPAILDGLLRDSLHFKGVVVTDALDMGAIVNTYGPGDAAVLAFQAGADLLLQPADPASAIDAVTRAVEEGRITVDRLDQSVRRILELKERLGLFRSRTVSLDSVPDIVGSARFLETARDIARRSITLVADRGGTVDSLRARPRTVALITYGEENAGTIGADFLKELRAAGHRVTLFRLWPASGPASLDSARAIARRNPYTILAVSVKAISGKGSVALPPPFARAFDRLAQRRHAVLVSFGSPYIGAELPHLRSYLLAWSGSRVSEWAAGRALSSNVPITGHLPVSLPPAYPLGWGLLRGVPKQE